MHQVDGLLQVRDCNFFGGIIKFDTLIDLLASDAVNDVAELFHEAVRCNLSLLKLQYLHEVPLEVVVVTCQVVLYLKHG